MWDVLGSCLIAGLEDPLGMALGKRTDGDKRTSVMSLAWLKAAPVLLGIALAGGMFIVWDHKCAVGRDHSDSCFLVSRVHGHHLTRDSLGGLCSSMVQRIPRARQCGRHRRALCSSNTQEQSEPSLVPGPLIVTSAQSWKELYLQLGTEGSRMGSPYCLLLAHVILSIQSRSQMCR